MSGKPLDEYEKDLKAYCEDNGLFADKAIRAPYSRIGNQLHLLYHNPDDRKRKNYNIGGTPCPVMLIVIPEAGGVRFEQTEHTRKYLGVEEEHDVVHTPRIAVA
jgi:hypothetical protein